MCGDEYVRVVHADDKATPETEHLFGSAEPRICTPPLRELTPETSLGFEVIDFARDVLGVTLLPWQRVALIRMLELREDGSLRFRTVVVLVARQNGKSSLAQILTIWLLFVYGWPLILGTAQDLDVAEALWEEVVDLVLDNDELAPLIAERGVTRVNGKKSLNLASGSKYKVKAANRRAGRGLSGNLVLLDELREHQTWEAWAAITKTTMARAEALILALSNAGDITSRVLRYLRVMAHKALGDPDGIAVAEDDHTAGPTQFDLDSAKSYDDEADGDDIDPDEFETLDIELDDMEQDEDTLCLLEWSAAPGRDRRDREGWRESNPSAGYTISFRTIASACKTDPEWVFRTEVLCQWNDGASSGPFTPGQWEATTIELVDGERQPKDVIIGPVVAAIATSSDRALTYIAFAGYRADGAPQVEVITRRYGSDWVGEWLSSPDRKGRIKAVTGQSKGTPESTLLKKLEQDQSFRIPVVELAGQALLDAHAEADDLIRDGGVWHVPQPPLDIAAQTAEKKYVAGGQWVLDPAKSPTDIAALRAWVAALWLLRRPLPTPPPPPVAPQALDTDPLTDLTGHGVGMDVDISTAGF